MTTPPRTPTTAAGHAEVDAAAWHAAVCESPTGKARAPLDDHLTVREQHRLACGTCGQRLRDHNEQSGHAFVRTFAPDPAPLDVERLARALGSVVPEPDDEHEYTVTDDLWYAAAIAREYAKEPQS